MLKAWICNPDTASLHIEEKYKTWVEELRTDRYVTVPLQDPSSICFSIFHVFLQLTKPYLRKQCILLEWMLNREIHPLQYTDSRSSGYVEYVLLIHRYPSIRI